MFCYSLEKQIPEKIIPIYANKVTHLKGMSVSDDRTQFAIYEDNGDIHVHDAKNKMLVFDIKVSGHPSSVKFVGSQHTMIIESKDGTIWSFDTRNRKCYTSMNDDGVINCTATGISNNYYASGCSSGAVNIYKYNGKISEKPIKQILNITTKITGIAFNNTNELCAIYSRWNKRAVRLVHLESMSVFSNFPSIKDRLKYITCADFSNKSGLLCIAEDTGRALLYKLNHFTSI